MSTTERFILIKTCCSRCERKFSSPRNLREHYINTCNTPVLNVQYKSGVKRRLPADVIALDPKAIPEGCKYTNEFICPGCYDLFKDLDTLDSHVKFEHGLDNVTQTTDESFTSIHKVSDISEERTPTDTEGTVTVPVRRAIEMLYPKHSNTDIQMITNIITSLNMTPFLMNADCTDSSEHEIIAISTPSQLTRILEIKTRGIKRVRLDSPFENAVITSPDCIHSNKMSNDTNLNAIIQKSAYRQLLAFEEYRHVTSEHLDLLNTHWRKRPHMYMVTSQLLSGAILVDGNQALLLNGVESYSRYSSIDAHFENVPLTQESSTPQLSSQYPNILKITKINMHNTEKLILGSKTMNILVISSIRIDDSELEPEVGPSTKNFNPSRYTRLFISTSSIELANKILNNPTRLMLSDPLVHMRQLQSKFHQHSTYSLARSYSVFTADITVQPYTIYTLVNSKTNSDTCCLLGSKIMVLIGNSICEEYGKLKKEDIIQLLPKQTTKKTQVVLDALKIIDQFKDESEVDIISNTSLCPYIRSIAVTTTNGLLEANKEIIKNIRNIFSKG